MHPDGVRKTIEIHVREKVIFTQLSGRLCVYEEYGGAGAVAKPGFYILHCVHSFLSPILLLRRDGGQGHSRDPVP